MAHAYHLKPIRPILWVSLSGINTIDAEQITIDRVGEKAFGLASLPPKWTLPFFVVSDELFDSYVKNQSDDSLMLAWESLIQTAAAQCKIASDDQIIVRSNARSEGLEDRGKFISVEGTLQEWPQLVQRCFDDFLLLCYSDRLQRADPVPQAARFYLDKNNIFIVAHNHINFAITGVEISF